MQSHTIRRELPGWGQSHERGSNLSLSLRICAVAMGSIVFLISLLVLFNIQGFSRLGTTTGAVGCSLSLLILLAGICIRKVNEPSSTLAQFPLNREILLMSEQVGRLKINGDGFSEELNCYRFECRELEGENWIVVRRSYTPTTVQLQKYGGQERVTFQTNPRVDRALLEHGNVPLVAIDHLPEMWNCGCCGQLYLLDSHTLFKLEKSFANARHGQSFYLRRDQNQKESDFVHYVEPLTTPRMADSFSHSIEQAARWMGLRESPFFPRCQGIVHVRDLNQWGVVFEKIEGNSLQIENFRRLSFEERRVKCKRLIVDCVEGLKCLHREGFYHGDIKEENLILRQGDQRPVFIDLSFSSIYHEGNLRDRHAIGTLLYRCLVCDHSTFQYQPSVSDREICLKNLQELNVSSTIIRLILRCWSNASMREFGWDEILRGLEADL